MLIKQSNLQSALTHIRECLATLATLNSDEQGYFHNHIVEQLTEAETLLNEANEPERGVIFTNITDPVRVKHFQFRRQRMTITEIDPAVSSKQYDGIYTIEGMGIKCAGTFGMFVLVDGYSSPIVAGVRRRAYEKLKEAKNAN